MKINEGKTPRQSSAVQEKWKLVGKEGFSKKME
jgi:hypothetical protein